MSSCPLCLALCPHACAQNVVRFEMSVGNPLRVVEGAARGKSRHVHDLATWVEAFIVLVQVRVDVASHRTAELLSYQGLIVEANRRFMPEGWLDYDRQFRIKAAADPSLKWDVIEPSLWQLATTGRTRSACWACGAAHPPSISGRCPFHPYQQLLTPALPANHRAQSSQVDQYAAIAMQADALTIARGTIFAKVCQGRHPASKCKRNTTSSISGADGEL